MEEEDIDMPIFGDNIAEMIKSNSKYPMAVEDISDDEKEDYYIKDTDALIVAGKVVPILSPRKNNTPVWKSTSTSKNKTTYSCITK